MIPSKLLQIAGKVRDRVELDRIHSPLMLVKDQVRNSRQPHNFLQAFTSNDIHVIAEVKLASPSEGDLAPLADPVEVAGGYLHHGAAAISVLTERDFFKGHPENLRKIRKAYPEALLLMKDFIVDDYQIYRARVDGADAILLILALLGRSEVTRFMKLAQDLGLSTLVEVHNEEEMRRAIDLGANLIGVNNRNLKTLEVSIETSERLAALAPRNAVLVSESGLRSSDDISRLSALGYRGFLIGSSFMKSSDPGLALSQLRGKLI